MCEVICYLHKFYECTNVKIYKQYFLSIDSNSVIFEHTCYLWLLKIDLH